jgi:hypothetical protein
MILSVSPPLKQFLAKPMYIIIGMQLSNIARTGVSLHVPPYWSRGINDIAIFILHKANLTILVEILTS